MSEYHIFVLQDLRFMLGMISEEKHFKINKMNWRETEESCETQNMLMPKYKKLKK